MGASGRKRSQSPMAPLQDSQRLQPAASAGLRSKSPLGLGGPPDPHSSTSVGPGLGALPSEKRNRSKSPMPLDDPRGLHSSTSVGPGLGALPLENKRRASSPIPKDEDRSRSPMAPEGGSRGAHAST